MITYEGYQAMEAFSCIKNKTPIAFQFTTCPESLNILVCIIYFVTVSHFHNWLCKKLLAGCQYFLKFDSTCVSLAREYLRLKSQKELLDCV